MTDIKIDSPPDDLKDWQNRKFKAGIRNSFIAHGLLAMLLLVGSVIAPKRPVSLQSSVRVDLVALPDFTKKEMQNMTPSDTEGLGKKLEQAEKKSEQNLAEAKKAAKLALEKMNHDEMVLKKEKDRGSKTGGKKEKMMSAIDRIKALQKIEESLGKSKKANSGVLTKGNLVSKGSGITGSQGDDYNEYADKMKAKLGQNWDLPVWLSRMKLSAQVLVYLDKYGGVFSTNFIRSSGNKAFDDYVLRTIKASQPFGAPPSEILDNGVQLGFPL